MCLFNIKVLNIVYFAELHLYQLKRYIYIYIYISYFAYRTKNISLDNLNICTCYRLYTKGHFIRVAKKINYEYTKIITKRHID